MGILCIGMGNRYEYLVSLHIRWRLDGPLASVIVPANRQFVKNALEQNANGQYSVAMGNRLITAQSAGKIKQGLQELRQQFEYLATQDQLFNKSSELELHKLQGVMGPFPVDELFATDAERQT